MAVVVVLSDCPPKLRGDMSKWFFEVNTGVYVGNFSARVRDNLWLRITQNIGKGHATMVFSSPGEQHLDFRVHNAYWQPVDFDGIKLMRRPEMVSVKPAEDGEEKIVSKPSQYRIAASRLAKTDVFAPFFAPAYVVLDFETTGLDAQTEEIIEIGAIYVEKGQISERMQTLVQCSKSVPAEITRLTGISDADLSSSGKLLDAAIQELLDFMEDFPLVCHNASFEQAFLQKACQSCGVRIENRWIDTLKLAQMLLPDLGNHKLSTLADYFKIGNSVCHRALTDCETTYGVYTNLMEIVRTDGRNNKH